MKISKRVCRAFSRTIKEVALLPKAVGEAIRRRQGQASRKASEAERLDRIRIPSKYLGI